MSLDVKTAQEVQKKAAEEAGKREEKKGKEKK